MAVLRATITHSTAEQTKPASRKWRMRIIYQTDRQTRRPGQAYPKCRILRQSSHRVLREIILGGQSLALLRHLHRVVREQ